MTLKIISTQEIIFTGEVKSVTLPGTEGAFTVLNHHASLISTLTGGTLSYTTEAAPETPETMNVRGGIADIDNDSNTVSVCIY